MGLQRARYSGLDPTCRCPCKHMAVDSSSVFLIYQLWKWNMNRRMWVRSWVLNQPHPAAQCVMGMRPEATLTSSGPGKVLESVSLTRPGQQPRSSGGHILSLGHARWPYLDQRSMCCRVPRLSSTFRTLQVSGWHGTPQCAGHQKDP